MTGDQEKDGGGRWRSETPWSKSRREAICVSCDWLARGAGVREPRSSRIGVQGDDSARATLPHPGGHVREYTLALPSVERWGAFRQQHFPVARQHFMPQVSAAIPSGAMAGMDPAMVATISRRMLTGCRIRMPAPLVIVWIDRLSCGESHPQAPSIAELPRETCGLQSASGVPRPAARCPPRVQAMRRRANSSLRRLAH